MKKHANWYAVLMSMAISISAVFFCASCKEDHDGPLPPAPQPSDRIEVTYPSSPSVEGGCTGTGTIEDPLVVGDGALTATIAVTGKYHDPDGSTVSCTSQATTRVSLSAGTPCVSIKDLLSVGENTGAPSVSSDGSKKTTRWQQTFTVGGKDIIFDQSYEEFTHTNSQGKVIPLPYLKITAVKYGSVNADEATTSRGIRLRQLAPTRAGVITDSVNYEVTVPFTVNYQSANTDNVKTDSLVIEVVFDVIAESETEIPDPTMEFSYELSHKSGTGSNASPFDVTPGDTLSLEWSGVSSYQYFSIPNRTGMEIKYEPKAFAKVHAEKADTMWIKDVADLKAILLDPVVATSGTNPVENTGLYAWNIADHKVMVNNGYQLYQPIKIEDTEVVFPSLAIGSPEIKVDVAEKTTTKTAKVYDVTLTIDQELTVVNTSEPQSERVQYVVKYIAAIPIEEPRPATLVDIQYREGYEWFEPHDNLPLRVSHILYRDSIFSDGSIHTVASYSLPPTAAGQCFIVCESCHGLIWGQFVDSYKGVSYYFSDVVETMDSDYNFTTSRTIGVPDISLVTFDHIQDDDELNKWDEYVKQGDITVHLDMENPQPSWYHTSFACRDCVYLCYNYAQLGGYFAYLCVNPLWNNWICYVVDDINGGQLFGFLDLQPEYDRIFTTENTTMPNGKPAIVVTLKTVMTWMGRTFSFQNTCTVYEYDAENPPF